MRKTISTLAVATIIALTGAPAMAGTPTGPGAPAEVKYPAECQPLVDAVAADTDARQHLVSLLVADRDRINAQQAKIFAQRALIRHLRHQLAAK